MTFEEELISLRPQLLAFCRSIALAKGEDLCQEAMCRALECKHQYRPDTNMKRWLFAIAVNHHRSVLRRDWRWKNETDFIYHSAEGDDANTSFEHILEAPDRPDIVMAVMECKAALMTLSKIQRQALLLIASGFGYEEVAKFQKVSVGTIKSRVGRARDQIKFLTGVKKDEIICN